MGFDQRDIAENVAARPVGDDPSGVEQDGAGAKLEHHFEVMGGDQLGARQALDELDQPPAAARVEVGGGFVEHEYGRIAGQHARETDAFALAEAQVMGRTLGLSRRSTRSRQSSAIRRASAAVFPRLSGPNATSSMTVLQKSWSSGS